MKTYLKNGDKVYTIGAYLRWNSEIGKFELDEIEDTVYYDRLPVEFDSKPYIEE